MKEIIGIMTSLVVLAVFSSIAICGDDWCCDNYSEGNPYNCYSTGNCTWYAYHKRPDLAPAITQNAG